MKTSLLFLLIVLWLSACGSVPTLDPEGVGSRKVQKTQETDLLIDPQSVVPVSTVTPDATPTPNQVQTALAVIEIDRATSTAAAAATSTSYAVTSTQEAKATKAFWVGVTFAVGTERATETQIAKTEVAGTQQSAAKTSVPPTLTALAATQTIEQSELKSKVAGTWILNVGGALVLIALFGVGVLAIREGVYQWKERETVKIAKQRMETLARDAQGRGPIVSSKWLRDDEKLINTDLMHRAEYDPKKADDLITEQALQNAGANKKLEVVRNISSSPAMSGLLKQIIKEEAAVKKPAQDVTITQPDIPLLAQLGMGEIVNADWKYIEDWECKGELIPCGVNKNGVAFVNIEENYHYGLFGLTGEGKSRRFLRPFLAALLASGHRAIILGKTGDFWMFETHPNVNLIPVRDLTDQTEARRYADYLKRMVREMNQRDEWLTVNHQSTWGRAGRENTFIVLDEIGNALEQMLKAERDECMRWIASLVKQGRKNGFNVITASQRAVGFKNIVEQMSRVAYRLADEASSRIALGVPGAESLPRNSGKFFSNFSSIELCGSFDPSDQQLIAFLHSRPVIQHEPLDWIDGLARDVEENKVAGLISNSAPVPQPAVPLSQTVPSALDEARRKP